MAKVFPGRYTAELREETIVFIIGMRVNHFWQFWKWWPVAISMPRMLRKLAADKELGLLHFYQGIGGRTTFLVQYWKSFDHLHRFAHDKDLPHLGPWRDYMKNIGNTGDVGVFHETYRVRPGDYECVYANMPLMGLPAATSHVPISKRGEGAKERLENRS
ncbi:MAG: DUF4188 domain-containing protein [Sandaracinaceae bacterium]|nr:DUF4188 domain-containing protein [Sandaracinaceae bacterium]